MNKNKLLQYTLLISSLFVTYISVSSAQAQALAGQSVNFFVHGLAFLFALALVVGVIYLRTRGR